MKLRRPPTKIANQLRYGSIALSAIAALLAGGLVAQLSFRALLRQTILLQQERSQAAAQEIDSYLNDFQNKLNYLARTRGFTDLPSSAQQNLLEALARHNEAFELVALLDNQGDPVVTASLYREVQLENKRERRLFTRTYQRKEEYIGPVEIDPDLQVPIVRLAVPVRNAADEVDGVLMAQINLKFLWVVAAHAEVGQTGYVYVLDNRLRLIALSGSSPESATLEDLSERPFIAANTSQILSPTREFLGSYRGLRQVEVLGVTAPIQSVPWNVMVELPTAEAYAPARQMAALLGGILVVVTAGAGTIGFLFSRQIVNPLNQLTAAAARIREGDLAVRVKARSQNELGSLAQTFNSMVGQLKDSFTALEAQNAEMKALNQALFESETRLTQFLDAMPVGVFVADRDGRGYYTNQTAQHLLGRGVIESEKVEQLTRTYQAYLAGSDQLYPRSELPIVKALRGSSARVDDMEVRHRDRAIPIECFGTPIYDERGEVSYAIAAFVDITERKKAENILADYNRTLERQVTQRTEELQLKNAQLASTLQQLTATQEELIQSEKMAALGQLVAGVAHEINTPLGAIRSSASNIGKFLQQTLEELPLLLRSFSPEEERQFLSLLTQAFEQHDATLSAKQERKLRRALTRQLEESAIAAADTLADTLVDMGIYENIEGFLPLFQKDNSQYILEIAYKLSALQRSTQIVNTATERASKVVFALKTYARYDRSGEKILTNLTEGIDTVLTLYQNQLKQGIEVIRHYDSIPPIWCYPDELNQVWTNLVHNAIQAMNERGTLTIDVSQHEERIQTRFTDTGKGIPPEIMSKIFEPFFTTKPPGEGSGLGLDIVRKIIHKHQGTIEVESVPGTTTFSISIPIHLPEK
ncbi:MAG: ATP-binding protein [Cyanobacteriota bacterium]|nr:ATP-binding protein [Cyanobacteriota bacterium]